MANESKSRIKNEVGEGGRTGVRGVVDVSGFTTEEEEDCVFLVDEGVDFAGVPPTLGTKDSPLAVVDGVVLEVGEEVEEVEGVTGVNTVADAGAGEAEWVVAVGVVVGVVGFGNAISAANVDFCSVKILSRDLGGEEICFLAELGSGGEETGFFGVVVSGEEKIF